MKYYVKNIILKSIFFLEEVFSSLKRAYSLNHFVNELTNWFNEHQFSSVAPVPTNDGGHRVLNLLTIYTSFIFKIRVFLRKIKCLLFSENYCDNLCDFNQYWITFGYKTGCDITSLPYGKLANLPLLFTRRLFLLTMLVNARAWGILLHVYYFCLNNLKAFYEFTKVYTYK